MIKMLPQWWKTKIHSFLTLLILNGKSQWKVHTGITVGLLARDTEGKQLKNGLIHEHNIDFQLSVSSSFLSSMPYDFQSTDSWLKLPTTQRKVIYRLSAILVKIPMALHRTKTNNSKIWMNNRYHNGQTYWKKDNLKVLVHLISSML